MNVRAEQRRLTASLPRDATDRVGCSALSRWLLPLSTDPRFQAVLKMVGLGQ